MDINVKVKALADRYPPKERTKVLVRVVRH